MERSERFLPLFLKDQAGFRAFISALVRDHDAADDLFPGGRAHPLARVRPLRPVAASAGDMLGRITRCGGRRIAGALLKAGELYCDFAAGAPQFAVMTEAGAVQHVGTKFSVKVTLPAPP